MFDEVHDGHRHEAIDILEPRGTPVYAVVSGAIRKLFPANRAATPFTSSTRWVCIAITTLIWTVTPHMHFAIFELGPEKQWWSGKAINPYPGLVAAVKRAKL